MADLNQDLPSNSISSRERRQIDGQAEGHVAQKSELSRTVGRYLNKSIDSLMQDARDEYVVPGVLKLAKDILDGLFNMAIDSRRNRDYRVADSRDPSRPRYRGYFDDPDRSGGSSPAVREGSNYEWDQLEFLERGQAEWVLDQLREIQYEDGYCTVAQFYELSKQKNINSSHYDYGWYDLRYVNVRRKLNDRYILTLDRPVPINRQQRR